MDHDTNISSIVEIRFDKGHLMSLAKETGKSIQDFHYAIKWKTLNPFFVNKGDELYSVVTRFDYVHNSFSYPVLAENSGFFIIDKKAAEERLRGLWDYNTGFRDIPDNTLLGELIKDIDVFLCKYPSSCIVTENEYDHSLQVKWEKVCGHSSPGFSIPPFLLSFHLISNIPTLEVAYQKASMKGMDIKKGDCFELRSHSGVISLPLVKNPTKAFGITVFYIPLSEECFYRLFESPIIDVRLVQEAWPSLSVIGVNKHYFGDIASKALFTKYVKVFFDAIVDAGYSWSQSSYSINHKPESCYVYLMIDTANGFHKIGMSNNPEYREHTLQSEKPTIELVFAKEYSSREQAASMESSLHSKYSKKRVRGEWFNLTEGDVRDIKNILNN